MKNKWLQYFPFKDVRPEQEKAINFILDAFEKRNKRFVILELPTGIGKSAIAVTLSKYFEHEVVGDIKSSYIVTTQKILQEQYKKDFPYLNNISSKTNYFCKNHPIGMTCDMGLKIAALSKNYKNYNCHYKNEKSKFDNSEIGLTNLSFFLSHKRNKKNTLKKRKLLVIDECHNMENIITDFSSLSFSKYFVEEKLKIKWVHIKNNNLNDFMLWVNNYYIPALQKKLGEIESLLNYKDSTYLASKSGVQMMRLADKYKNKITQLEYSSINDKQWIMTTSDNSDKIELRPIFASNYTEHLIFSGGEKILLMSGTILDKKTYCDNNGIFDRDTDFISLDSPFPVKNRPIFLINSGKMGRKTIDKTLPIMVENVKILLEEHKNEKGIIHCNSYKISNYIKNNIDDERLLFHSTDDRYDILNFHMTTKEPSVIVSPSFMEGVDLYGKYSRFQIILKIPFLYLGDNYIRTKMEKIQGWYAWNAIKSLIQSTGRSVRSYEDWAVTYILDGDFNYLLNRNKHLFPKWFLDAIQN